MLPPILTAPVFSWELYVNGLQVVNFGEMSIKHQCGGYGTSGCISAAFDVEIYGEDVKITEPAPRNAEVKLICPDDGLMNPPLFYISTRSVDGDRITLHCFDRMMNTQQTCSLTAQDFTETETADGEKNYSIKSANVLAHIASQCGFTGGWTMRINTGAPDPEIEFKKDDVYKRSCRQILDTLADILKGCWICSNDTLTFVPFMPPDVGGLYEIPQHTAIVNKGSRQFTRVELTDGYETFVSGGAVSSTNFIIRGDTPYASQKLADYVYCNIYDKLYSAFFCEKGVATMYIPAMSYVSFGDGTKRYVNDVTLYPTGQGLFISCGCNAVAEEEFDYLNSLERGIKNTIAKNELVGNLAVTESKGLTFFRNLNK